ncbi:response regulator transcription factor [Streptomyces sp. NBC_00347]|uniref:helix-turn-helix transcriptional regulator n=1 Tax=Streptomyces sp. NBC_00347 TaxID=2975721 RepID=UPI0022558B87|nr:response regulator transcription factor [Streptomyces sp. NBC_00347]MCX5129854.1 response regulator transcription factor [Streptomyces sp. NBC_00347]
MGTGSDTRHDTGSGPDRRPAGRSGRFGRIARSPIGWLLTGVAGGLVSGLTATGPGPVPVLGAAAAVAVYWWVMHGVAGRPTPEIARRGAVREALLGGGIGLGFILVPVLLPTACGGYSFSWAGRGFIPVLWTTVMVLVGGIRTVARGDALLAPAVTRHLIGHFAEHLRPAHAERDSVAETLTPRELEVFQQVARGLSNAEIAAALFITPETVKTYVSRILAKLGLRDRVQAVVLAHRIGLMPHP